MSTLISMNEIIKDNKLQVFGLLIILNFLLPGMASAVELSGVKSKYSEVILKLKDEQLRDVSDLTLTCLQDPLDPWYVGVKQLLSISAPIHEVQKVIEAFDEYRDLFPGYADVHVVSKDRDLTTVFWEQRIPIPFVPNVKYEMIYAIDKTAPSRSVYLYRLKSATKIISSDGIIILQKDGEYKTHYMEVDYFNADWGAAKVFGKDRIWKDAVIGIYLSDLALKLKSEKPELTAKEARTAAEAMVIESKVDECVRSRK